MLTAGKPPAPPVRYNCKNGKIIAVYERDEDGTYKRIFGNANQNEAQARYVCEASIDAEGNIRLSYIPVKLENTQKPEEKE